jgi:putative heme iron utilization protein
MEKKKLMAKDEIKRFIKENNIKDIAGIEESFEYSKNEVYTKYLTNPTITILYHLLSDQILRFYNCSSL